MVIRKSSSTVEKSEGHSCLQVGHRELQDHHPHLCPLEGDGASIPGEHLQITEGQGYGEQPAWTS